MTGLFQSFHERSDGMLMDSRSGPAALIVFMRYPEPGKVKTPLAASIGEEEAACVYDELLRFTLGVVGDFKRERPEVDGGFYPAG
jgi:glycosyltransferase A (GT-A) superfamily protein (DUF2064 family)